MTADQRERRVVRVEGVVQGVGFRPFVYALAGRLGLDGLVGNDADGVFIEVEGPPPRLAQFLNGLTRDAPALACVERVRWVPAAPTGSPGFSIVASAPGGTRRAPIPADTATCADCLREVDDPADRRFRYPFTNCTACGPRFTIVHGVPYDRPRTTMAAFPMCPACSAEYHDPADRRFHAQPTCCPACGPRLRLVRDGVEAAGDPIVAAARLVHDGGVLAVKGLGGYHLAVRAADEDATAELRRRKRREEKPFALMVADLAQAGSLCHVDDAGAECLTCRQRPAVLLDRLPEARVAAAVAPGNRHLALMLPYTALHHLLLREIGEPVVLTSGNVSDEPIAHLDEDAARRLAGIADAFLVHDRPIQTRTDDSVVRPLPRRTPMVIRRSRGYVPDAVALPVAAARPILACGGELKNTFCLAQGRRAVVSHHIGDLENYETLQSYTQGIAHMRRLLDLDPAVIAHDLHPEYLSTKYALEIAEQDERLTRVEVQHHHAHIASCLADNGECGPVIGVAFDGLGYGGDGTLWGGEFLLADLRSARRAAHLQPVPMPGGAAAIRQPWRMAAAYLDAAFGDDAVTQGLAVRARNQARWTHVVELGRVSVNSPLTSSAGRLFDAVGSLVGLRDVISFEGQAAIALEQIADRDERGSYELPVSDGSGGPLRLHGADLVRAAALDVLAGVEPCVVAARVHHGIADAIARVCRRLREETGVASVALSGGVFQNVLLLGGVVRRLEAAGMRVLTHRQVPPNDGGISLGQAAVAAARASGD